MSPVGMCGQGVAAEAITALSGAGWFVHRDCLPRIEACCRRHFDDVEIREAA